jgi:hypothetical protein
MKSLLIFGLFNLILFLASSCATPSSKMIEVSIGMTKNEVIKQLGMPQTVRANGGQEELIYQMANSENGCWSVMCTSPYKVVIVNGVVTAYGRDI